MLFIQGVFYIPSHCDINMVLIMLQEDSRSGTRHVTYGLAFKWKISNEKSGNGNDSGGLFC